MAVENNLEKQIVKPSEHLEKKASFEVQTEKKLEQREVSADKKVEKPDMGVPVTAGPVVVTDTDYRKQREAAVDSILADGLDQVFLKMSPEDQRRFKAEGEKTAAEINRLLDKAKVGVSKVMSLIKRWLGLIPGVNKYFLEQEAKIKADKILKIKKSL
ncbi:hypothetical protein CVU83_01030 [Candidatus Falkowbacteria bacterium HGW-Falkowbacteria-2]|uniref:Uncharacterized protein n=1 Tax=Candidatus Falkowbacteria bacterium HGW-Falkowbacteria-2 TaxID=2013769 RepID=A0A2N2E2E4_9BACT|nr:MAG: hypothetical protein CVU83_01030 [Candidatus Falkowbacteria bacterium HGW-Falkowbacteria-2]